MFVVGLLAAAIQPATLKKYEQEALDIINTRANVLFKKGKKGLVKRKRKEHRLQKKKRHTLFRGLFFSLISSQASFFENSKSPPQVLKNTLRKTRHAHTLFSSDQFLRYNTHTHKRTRTISFEECATGVVNPFTPSKQFHVRRI